MRRTLVIIHPGALGDVLLAVLAIKQLRVRFPKHTFILISNATVGRLLHDCQLIDIWMSIQEMACAEMFAGAVPTSGDLRLWLERCDLAVAWVQDVDGTLTSTLRCCGAKETVVRSPFTKELQTRHQSDRFLEVISGIVSVTSLDRGLCIPSHLWERGRAHLECEGIPMSRPLALVHPGSGSRHKCMNPESLALAAERIQQEDWCLVLIAGPADDAAVSEFLKLTCVKPKVMRGLSLSVLAGVIAQAALYIGHDSGLTHLSALIGTPTVALFGPTSSERWAPRGPHVTVLRGAPCTCRSWDDVGCCIEKPCFAIPVETILTACRSHQMSVQNPRNPMQCALSPATP